MIFANFKLTAFPKIMEATCKCGNFMEEMDNGFLSAIYYCEKCKAAYEPKMVKIPIKRLSKEFVKKYIES